MKAINERETRNSGQYGELGRRKSFCSLDKKPKGGWERTLFGADPKDSVLRYITVGRSEVFSQKKSRNVLPSTRNVDGNSPSTASGADNPLGVAEKKPLGVLERKNFKVSENMPFEKKPIPERRPLDERKFGLKEKKKDLDEILQEIGAPQNMDINTKREVAVYNAALEATQLDEIAPSNAERMKRCNRISPSKY